MSFEEILIISQRINRLSQSIIHTHAFQEQNVALPNRNSPEPSFIRATSWLYCLYFESGRVSIKFLKDLGQTYSVVDKSIIDEHLEVVRSLRTELHHNLGFENSDAETRRVAESWCRGACSTSIPNKDEDWAACYTQLVLEATSLLKKIEEVVRSLEQDSENCAYYAAEWHNRLKRSWPAAKFDPLIEDIKIRLGRNSLNTVEFRNRNLRRWTKALEILEDGFSFEFEATRLIEKSMLDDSTLVIPITGNDIITILGLAPGPEVGKLLAKARTYFSSKPCNKDELLSYLKDCISEKN
ncbi:MULTISPECIES: hypothetical protein [unclassified Pseudoalteromonas]|uniref:hypothetical protein n=1 Tax=unclassified Pseudoalteromonas TaxID=194690 RepID=UPI00209838B2|nr:hypothetical protein [Pseudoalteromonas sp. XMcav2-N]MCO7188111.1 hypothetical protein [Pseudoalteromonas sp. XMcav2-N]